MKNKIALSLLALLVAIVALAAHEDKSPSANGKIPEDKIVITTVGGNKTEYNTSEIKEISFEDDKMTIVRNDDQTVIYDVNEVDSVIDPAIKAVDLGLSVKWAPMNIGAKKPNEPGTYFAWGETEPKKRYEWNNSNNGWDKYKWEGVSRTELESLGVIDSNGNLTAEYDAAAANWGKGWRMPTLDEIKELIDHCSWVYTTLDGQEGFLVKNKWNSIFLPFTGYLYSEINNASYNGFYWSATLSSYDDKEAFYLKEHYEYPNGSWRGVEEIVRKYGLPIRPVKE